VTQVIGRFWAWLFLLILVVFFSLASPAFLSLFNLQSIVANAAILLILALGQTFVIITGGIDLSVGYILGMVSVISVAVMTGLAASLPVPVAVLIGVLVGLAIGVLAGTITSSKNSHPARSEARAMINMTLEIFLRFKIGVMLVGLPSLLGFFALLT